MQDLAVPFLSIHPKELKGRTWTDIYLYIHVQSNIIHNSQKVETTQVFTDEWMDKQNVVYTQNGLLFSLKKEGNSGTC